MEEETHNKEVMNFEETDHWTFVNAEDIATGKAEHYCEHPEDFSDSYSDHESGSDSGSSIVVIDSQQTQALSTSSSGTISNTTQKSNNSNDINEDDKKTLEVETQGLDEELVHLFDNQPEVADPNEEGSYAETGTNGLLADGALNNEDDHQQADEENTSQKSVGESFVKEGSPFEKLEMPDAVEQVKITSLSQDDEIVVDHINDQDSVQNDNLKEEDEPSCPSQSTDLDLNMAQIPVPAEDLDQSCHVEEVIPSTNNSENESAPIIIEDSVVADNKSESSDLIISFQIENQEDAPASENCVNAMQEESPVSEEITDDLKVEDKEPEIHVVASNNEEDISIHAQQIPQQGEGEWASGDDSPSDDSDDETWDLSIEAFVNTGSLASSISSLILQPSSPSPSLAMANDEAAGPYPAGHVKIKPDLLEEANRIEELDQLDYSTVSNPDLPADLNLANIFRERHYVHHPNQRLNVQLSYVVAFAMAAVAGFALGHIVGLSDNFPSRCTFSSGNKQANNPIYEGWTEDDWQTEIQRLTEENEELQRALDMNNNPSNSRFDLQLNELLSENWDLKRSVARIRYGKPVRSIEDRANINRLQTENDDLRAAVGKLRYQCGQLKSTPRVDESTSTQQNPLLTSNDLLWNTLDAMNLTNEWNNAVNNHNLQAVSGQLEDLKDLAADLMRLIGLRREELINMTRQNSSRPTQKMESTLKKSAQKVLDLMERLNNRKISLSELTTDLEKRLVALRLKLDTTWKKLYEQVPETGGESTTSSSNTDEKSLNSDWFLSMGQQREKLRQNEENFQKQTHWIFERARNRDRTRKSHNNKKQKMFHGDNSWNQFSA